MHSMLLLVSLAATPAVAYTSPDAAAEVLAAQIQTGTLIVSEGDCLAVKVFTNSPYTHVGGVVVEGGRAFVYDSQNGVGVRKQTLENYLASTSPDELRLLNPQRPFEEGQARAFRICLEDQLGRPYSVRHHLTGERCEGVHCSEYMTDALMAADVINAERPPRVSPASLRSGLLRHQLYTETHHVLVAEVKQESAPQEDAGWCARLWFSTKECCAGCWSSVRSGLLCR